MTLANGRHLLAIPGPSAMPDAVLQAMHRAAPNIYTGELHDITHSLVPDLRRVARTEGHVAMYIGNGHAAWEAALVNVLSPGDKVLALITGSFGIGWAEVCVPLGVAVERLDFGKEAPVDPSRVEEVLRADTGHAYKAVLAVHVDTSTSVRSDVAAIRRAMDAAGHPALLMADCIASLACDRFEMDDWGVDVLVTGSQKGLMTPPGMCFVFFSDKADRARDTAECVTAYWDWRPRVAPEMYFRYFNGTAPTHHIYGLRVALDMLSDEGMEAVWARHETLARAIWAALDTWAMEGPLRPNVPDHAHRSVAVTTVGIGAPNGTKLRDWLTENYGVTLGIGLGMAPPGDPEWHGYFRLGHMGHVNAHMVMGTLGAMDAGLKALAIPHGAGALEAASRALTA